MLIFFLSFNSSKVRYDVSTAYHSLMNGGFQFLKGTIRQIIKPEITIYRISFQFLKGTIRLNWLELVPTRWQRFNSSKVRYDSNRLPFGRNGSLVSIPQRYDTTFSTIGLIKFVLCFNSSKVRYDNQKTFNYKGIAVRFNSSKVRYDGYIYE